LSYVDEAEEGHNAAKAAIDIALHDLKGKILNKACYELLGIKEGHIPYSSYTIGIDTTEIIKEKLERFKDFKILKIKLGKGNDKELINTVKSLSNKIFSVDANQGWGDKQYALDMAYWLKEQGAIFLEQPFHKDNLEDSAWLTEKSPLPVIADESIKRLADISKAKGAFHGVNIKLMKSTGIHEAHKMIKLARKLNLKVMIGCMTETSCAISAAAQLAPLADWCDLDGAYLIKNDPFIGNKVKKDGEIILDQSPGLGILKIDLSKQGQ
jgi:L-alanine-DL-glutamate epimerase-like enolase superfamily enzyme